MKFVTSVLMTLAMAAGVTLAWAGAEADTPPICGSYAAPEGFVLYADDYACAAHGSDGSGGGGGAGDPPKR